MVPNCTSAENTVVWCKNKIVDGKTRLPIFKQKVSLQTEFSFFPLISWTQYKKKMRMWPCSLHSAACRWWEMGGVLWHFVKLVIGHSGSWLIQLNQHLLWHMNSILAIPSQMLRMTHTCTHTHTSLYINIILRTYNIQCLFHCLHWNESSSYTRVILIVGCF